MTGGGRETGSSACPDFIRSNAARGHRTAYRQAEGRPDQHNNHNVAMRLSTSLWLPALASLVQAATSQVGHLYISEPNTSRRIPETTTVTPETARLILASRLGLDRYHSLGSANEDTINAVNKFGAQQELFTSDAETPFAILLGQGVSQEGWWHEGQPQHGSYTDGTVASSIKALSDIEVSPVPSAAENEQLLRDLLLQNDRTNARGIIFETVSTMEDFTAVFEKLKKQDYSIIALAMPNSVSSVGWGSYEMPTSTGTIHKRERNIQEAPLSDSSLAAAASLETDSLAAISASNTTVLAGILPQCFSSQSACRNMTRNCTGHGSCSLKYTDRDASSPGGAPCWSCSCTADVRTNPDGTKKTTNWGGPACQKKDVVMPFWLLAGFTVILVFLISWGVGLLLSMGNEELPSVIGSGVSGVTRK